MGKENDLRYNGTSWGEWQTKLHIRLYGVLGIGNIRWFFVFYDVLLVPWHRVVKLLILAKWNIPLFSPWNIFNIILANYSNYTHFICRLTKFGVDSQIVVIKFNGVNFAVVIRESTSNLRINFIHTFVVLLNFIPYNDSEDSIILEFC